MLIITNILYFITQSFLQVYIQFSAGTRSIIGADGTVPIYCYLLSILLTIIMLVVDVTKTKKKKYWILEICILLAPFFSYKNRPNSMKNDILKIKGECYEKISFRCGTVVDRKTLGDPHQSNRHNV